MKTSLFDFDLPEALIAAHPTNPRDSARMLVVAGDLQDKIIRDLPRFLKPDDVMVFNDTKVIPARLLGKRGEAKVEVLLHKHRGQGAWQCFAKPAKRLKPGDHIDFAADFHADVVEKLPDGEVVLSFSPSPLRGEGWGGGDFYSQLEKYGHMPLPPYIRRSDDASDRAHYQTIYARAEGSVAAPTAGLHFTESLLAAIDAAGVTRAQVTLHVGGGTFLPVKCDDTDDHVMHSEWAEISPAAADAINAAKDRGGRVIAVGTTSLRTLESATDARGRLKPNSFDTSIFITPGYKFKIVDAVLTNFHLPCSTLFMLVAAFAGLERMKTAYAHAIAHNYRFYSYGDACLLTK